LESLRAAGRALAQAHARQRVGRRARADVRAAQLGPRRGGAGLMPYRWVRPEDLEWADRPALEGQEPRQAGDATTRAGLTETRARRGRSPPHSVGRRHRDHAQEEVFVVISGTLTMLLGDEPERVDLGTGGVVAVEPMT